MTRLLRALPTGEIARFAVIGIGATLTHYLLLTLFVEVIGIGPVIGTALAFCVAFLVTFFGQALWVFRDRGGAVSWARFRRFAVSVIGGLLGNTAIMALSVNLLGLPYQVGFAIAVIVVAGATFLINRFWVFGVQATE